MEKLLSYKYSFKYEKKISIILAYFFSIIFFIISFLIFIYFPFKWYYGIIFSVTAFYSVINTIWHKKSKIVYFDSNFIYVRDDGKMEIIYNINNLLVFKRLFFEYYILKIKNEQGFIDKIFIYVKQYGKLFLTKEAKELIKFAKTVKYKGFCNHCFKDSCLSFAVDV